MPVQYDFKHDIDTVLSHLHDYDTVVDRCKVLNESVAHLDIERVGIEVIITIEKQVQSDAPGIMRKLFAASQTTRSTDVWWPSDGYWRNENKIDIVGMPLVITSEGSLVPTKDGCRLTVEYFAKGGFKMLNGQVEKLTVKQSREGLLKGCGTISEMLDAQGRIVRA